MFHFLASPFGLNTVLLIFSRLGAYIASYSDSFTVYTHMCISTISCSFLQSLTSFPLGSLPGLPRSVRAGNPCSSRSIWGLVGYSLVTPRSTSVWSDFGSNCAWTVRWRSGGWGSLSGRDVIDNWRGSHRSLHILLLEMLAVKFALQYFKSEIQSRLEMLGVKFALVHFKQEIQSRTLLLFATSHLQ